MSEAYEDDLDQDDGDEELGAFTADDCGRWLNGKLTHSCSLLGSEDCDWECPLRSSL